MTHPLLLLLRTCCRPLPPGALASVTPSEALALGVPMPAIPLRLAEWMALGSDTRM